MPTLVWKLLRQHISIGQLAGFFLANLFGMMIVLLSVQFYKDIIPVFTEGDRDLFWMAFRYSCCFSGSCTI